MKISVKTLNKNLIIVDTDNHKVNIPHLQITNFNIGVPSISPDYYQFCAFAPNKPLIYIRLNVDAGASLTKQLFPRQFPLRNHIKTIKDLNKNQLIQMHLDFLENEGYIDGEEYNTFEKYAKAKLNFKIKLSQTPFQKGDEYAD
jgi:hypothetical protein